MGRAVREEILPSVHSTLDTSLEKNSSSTHIGSTEVCEISSIKLNRNDVKEFACGWGAAVINVTVTYPINKIIFRQILEDMPVTVAVKQLSQEGIRFLYRGILPPLCQKTLSVSVMFSTYEGSKRRLCFLMQNQTMAKMCAAGVAGTTEAILMPLERVQTLLQDWRYHDKFKNMSHAFRYLLTQHGVRECYRGVVPIIYRNSCSNFMFFMLRDQSKSMMSNPNSLLANFISGALIGGLTSTIFYPMNVIKIHMQCKIGGKFERLVDVSREIYISRDRSLIHFFKGVHLNYLRSFISWGVISASYDFLKQILFR